MICDWCETGTVAHAFALLPETQWHRTHSCRVLESPVLNPFVLVLHTPPNTLTSVRLLVVALMLHDLDVWSLSFDDRRYCHAAVYQIMTSRRCSNHLLPSFDSCLLLWLVLLQEEYVTSSGDVYLTVDTLQRLVHGTRCLLHMFARRGPLLDIEVHAPFQYTREHLAGMLDEHAVHTYVLRPTLAETVGGCETTINSC